VQRYRDGGAGERPSRTSATTAHPLPSAVNLFKFYKRLIVEANETSTVPDQFLLELVPLLKRYLHEYAQRWEQLCAHVLYTYAEC